MKLSLLGENTFFYRQKLSETFPKDVRILLPVNIKWSVKLSFLGLVGCRRMSHEFADVWELVLLFFWKRRDRPTYCCTALSNNLPKTGHIQPEPVAKVFENTLAFRTNTGNFNKCYISLDTRTRIRNWDCMNGRMFWTLCCWQKIAFKNENIWISSTTYIKEHTCNPFWNSCQPRKPRNSLKTAMPWKTPDKENIMTWEWKPNKCLFGNSQHIPEH